MADFEVTPIYNQSMRQVEKEFVDTELFNTRFQQLLNNDAYLKENSSGAGGSGANIVQVSKLNVKINDIFEIKEGSSDKPTVIQAYKFVDGQNNIINILKVFDNTDSESFTYDSDNVNFSSSGMEITGNWDLGWEANDGFFESEQINKDEFYEIYKIEVI